MCSGEYDDKTKRLVVPATLWYSYSHVGSFIRPALDETRISIQQ